MGSRFNWTATFLNSSVSPVSVRDQLDHSTAAELASKLAWAIGTTLELPYRKESLIRDDCKYLAEFIVTNLNE